MTAVTNEIITGMRQDLIRQKKINDGMLEDNKQLMRIAEEMQKEKRSVEGCLLSEYKKRLLDAEKKYKEFQEKRNDLLTQFANENKEALAELQAEKEMITEIHRKLLTMHNDNKKLKQKVDKQLEEKKSLGYDCIKLDTELTKLRKNHARLFTEAEEYRSNIKKLKEIIEKNSKLQNRINADKELSELIVECAKEIKYEREGESRILCREV
jgi:DNA repair exonuclease SbcCD ATPase subunit